MRRLKSWDEVTEEDRQRLQERCNLRQDMFFARELLDRGYAPARVLVNIVTQRLRLIEDQLVRTGVMAHDLPPITRLTADHAQLDTEQP